MVQRKCTRYAHAFADPGGDFCAFFSPRAWSRVLTFRLFSRRWNFFFPEFTTRCTSVVMRGSLSPFWLKIRYGRFFLLFFARVFAGAFLLSSPACSRSTWGLGSIVNIVHAVVFS